MSARTPAYWLIGLAFAGTAVAATGPTLLDRVTMPSPSRPALTVAGAPTQVVRRVIIRNQLILKIPLQPRQSHAMQFQVLDAPQCLSTRAIQGARMSGSRTIDFLLSRERRLRVHMDNDCKSLDFYGGFYLQPIDERLCAGRDVIRTRMGGNCKIERFQLLKPLDGSPVSDD